MGGSSADTLRNSGNPRRTTARDVRGILERAFEFLAAEEPHAAPAAAATIVGAVRVERLKRMVRGHRECERLRSTI